jgi:hypothetical protein
VRKVLCGVLAALVVVGGVACVQTYRVHESSWDWRLTQAAVPTKLTYQGRDYLRGTEQEPVDGVSVQARTPGGGEILDDADPGTETLIWVRDGDASWAYGLMGGS